jgi:DnaK suppressor protein
LIPKEGIVKNVLNDQTLTECKLKLQIQKGDILNRIRNSRISFSQSEKSGDEADQSVAHIEEHAFLVSQDRMRLQLFEIESALARIDSNVFGICEETLEPIEVERLLAIPSTRLSIEGAELREAVKRKFARY